MYRVIVTGGRHYGDGITVDTTLNAIHADKKITHLIHGGATGADALGKLWARYHGVQDVACEANWLNGGNSAGPRRNKAMAQLGADLCVAFPGKHGTNNMTRTAREYDIPVKEVK